ncbi:MAG: response regulator transcription factor [Actinobacteria bacterium]|nr:response regulator transcription factor [Actinomycetota bacterium]
MIRVLLADDHSVVRAGLEQLLNNTDELEVVGSASDGLEAVALSDELDPDVVLMDLRMPVLDGIEATRRILEARPTTRIVVLTSFSERDRILEALDAGALGYLLKDAEPDELLRGIRAAGRGESPLAPKVAQAVLADRAQGRPAEKLTDREREILTLLAKGLANKQIARRLSISEKTVKAHLTNVFRRIGVEDRTQAALWAERQGLITQGSG